MHVSDISGKNHMESPALSSLIPHLLALKLLPRTGWLQRGVRDVESVAEHSFGVAVLCLLIGDQIADIDRGRLLAIALLHDLAESLLSDLPASATRLLGKEAKRQAERDGLAALIGHLSRSDEYLTLWDEYVDGTSREARLVKAVDRLELMAQALAYERSGVRGLDSFWPLDDEWATEFPPVAALAAHLRTERSRSSG
ncbi:MAG TPA: HD domain-containing protein [Chloroflexus aurantiacus]|jgi:putative hydrolase of HD superfamily|uniref:5'-deoxynucleotidase n=2 Tax=Chloroflexaceae TaxID=1106 RepID=A9WDC5_CHLAA|nr:metal-dependent phosphohydrolase HD sub domain [Chloroflexus aurantiacus J-10-fl]RMG49622.1 MAG: HD domain-containing protein [Chloroflexota bacterium]HBW66008.1 HD domain-containing protein [Chloroflexus aurantiacus]